MNVRNRVLAIAGLLTELTTPGRQAARESVRQLGCNTAPRCPSARTATTEGLRRERCHPRPPQRDQPRPQVREPADLRAQLLCQSHADIDSRHSPINHSRRFRRRQLAINPSELLEARAWPPCLCIPFERQGQCGHVLGQALHVLRLRRRGRVADPDADEDGGNDVDGADDPADWPGGRLPAASNRFSARVRSAARRAMISSIVGGRRCAE